MANKMGKINQNCTHFSSVQDMETLFVCIVGFSGSANSNMLTKILREQRVARANQIYVTERDNRQGRSLLAGHLGGPIGHVLRDSLDGA